MAVGETGYGHPYCEQGSTTCTELNQYVNGYTGHDEPSLLFYSNTPGSGNNATYRMTLPTDPPALPRQNGSGGLLTSHPPPPVWIGLARYGPPTAPHPGGSRVCPDMWRPRGSDPASTNTTRPPTPSSP